MYIFYKMNILYVGIMGILNLYICGWIFVSLVIWNMCNFKNDELFSILIIFIELKGKYIIKDFI